MTAHDSDLLKRYAREGCEDSFAEVVRRHIDLVWGAARRITNDPDLAGDIAQQVFSDLARKARFVSQGNIPGWLYRAATLASRKALRTNIRRARREKEAMQDHLPTNDSSHNNAAEGLLPILDEGLRHLPDKDRAIVVLRFFARKSLADIGRDLAISEDAAQKRVSRALDRLKTHFEHNGHSTSAASVLAALTAASANAAPAGLSAGICAVAVKSAALAAGPLSWTFSQSAAENLLLMKSKIVITGLAIVAASTPLFLQQRTIAALEREREGLAVNNAATAALDQSHLERQLAAEWAQHQRDRAELERLRLEAGRLRAASISPVLQLELAEARENLEAAQAATKLASDTVQAEQLREQTVHALGRLGFAARTFSTANNNRLPHSFGQMTNQIPEPRVAGMWLGRFEFLPHEREINERETTLMLFREREPRKLPNGKWQRAYTRVDGAVIQIDSETDDFSQWEEDHIARKEPQ